MRVCHDADMVREAFAGVQGPTLVDRFLENAIEIDVDAFCDGTDTYVAAVMQHVEEAGVHSGDSTCVLPAQSLTPESTAEIHSIVRRLGPALGVVGVVNVQLAVSDDEVFVLEVNPRASRTVPFASKAIGVNLVEAACKLAAGATLAELDLPDERPPRQVSVKAAVLPFARFPGADPVLGPEMRSTGEVMTSAADLPTAFAKAETLAPDFAEVHMNLGLLYQLQDRTSEAMVELRRALKIKPALAGANFFLGVDYCKLGEGTKAISYLKAALQAEPKRPDIWLWLATAQEISGQLQAEVVTLHRALELQPDAADPLYLLGAAYERLGKKEVAPPSDRCSWLIAQRTIARGKLCRQQRVANRRDSFQECPGGLAGPRWFARRTG